MDRKKFIRNSLVGLVGMASADSALKFKNVNLKKSTYDKMIEQVGFNHLPTNSDVFVNHKNGKMKP